MDISSRVYFKSCFNPIKSVHVTAAIAVFKDPKSERFGLFDSHDRSPEGLPLPEGTGGTAVVLIGVGDTEKKSYHDSSHAVSRYMILSLLFFMSFFMVIFQAI